MNFKISEEQKENLLKRLNIEEEVQDGIESISYALEKKGVDCNKIQKRALEEIKGEIDTLKKENILSERLVKFLRKNIEIDISDEMLNEIESKLSDNSKENYKKSIENARTEKKIDRGKLALLISLNNQKKDGIIELEPSLQEKLQKVDKYRYLSMEEEKSKNNIVRIEENLKKGKIEYRDYIELTSDHNLSQYDGDSQVTGELELLYEKGIISEEQFYEMLGKEENNPGVKKFDENYEENKKLSLDRATEEAIEIINNLPEGVSQETRQKLELLLQKIEDLETMSTEQLEEFVEKFNEISNEEWKKYLESDEKILFHSTSSSIKGQFIDNTMSTSLIEKDHLETYRGEIGYRIKPNIVTRASGEDTYELNSRRDKYAATSSILVNLPQNVSKEMKEKKTYSEVDTTDYTIESAFIVDPQNKSNLEKIKEMAKAQGIHIDTFDGKRFVGIEEYFLDKQTKRISDAIANIKDNKEIKEKLGITEFYDEEEFIKNNIMEKIQDIEQQKGNWTRKEQITCAKNLKLVGDLDEYVEEINSKLYEKYQISLDKKAQELIKGAKIEDLEIKSDLLKESKLGINFFEKIFGKQKLVDEKIEALSLQKQKIELEEIETIPDENRSIEGLIQYCNENGTNTKISDFLKKYATICKDDSLKEKINETLNKTNESEKSKEYALVLQEKTPLFQINKQTKKLREENEEQRKENNSINNSNRNKEKFTKGIKFEENPEIKKGKELARMLEEISKEKQQKTNIQENER